MSESGWSFEVPSWDGCPASPPEGAGPEVPLGGPVGGLGGPEAPGPSQGKGENPVDLSSIDIGEDDAFEGELVFDEAAYWKDRELKGSAVPRVWTPEKRKLTPKTSLGFECIWFAENVLKIKLIPWQKWLLVHALELNDDGKFRFRTVVVLVARQNGKTTLVTVLHLWKLYMGYASNILGVAQTLDVAQEAYERALEYIEDDDDLSAELDTQSKVNGKIYFRLSNKARYKIGPANRKAGRGYSIDHLTMDELREQRTFDSWSALSKTTMARPNAQIWTLSNAGDAHSVVLNRLRTAAMNGINNLTDDDSLGIFEWSAEDGCKLDDRVQWRYANPSVGYTFPERNVRSALTTDPENVFRTEVLCQNVDVLDVAISHEMWVQGNYTGNMDDLRDRVSLCLDVSPDLSHVVLAAAAQLENGIVHTEIVHVWHSRNATNDCRKELRGLLDKIKPVRFGWFPSGPAASIAADLKLVKEKTREEFYSDKVTTICQELAEYVASKRVVHPVDPLLEVQILGVSRLYVGDGWRFSRRGGGYCNAIYAVAGAVHLARMTPPRSKLRIIT